QCSKKLLLDHLVSAQQKPLREVQSKGLGGGEIDDEIELGRLLDGQVSGLCPAQNSCPRIRRRAGTYSRNLVHSTSDLRPRPVPENRTSSAVARRVQRC